MLALQGASAHTPPPPLPVVSIPPHRGWSPLWWVGCHGGAGASTLARLTGLGVDAGSAWPDTGIRGTPTNVVLVCRLTAAGTWAATGAVDQWRRRPILGEFAVASPYLLPPDVDVVGVVAVPASPRRPPRLATDRLRLLSGWVPHVWRIGWVDALLAADDPTDVGLPPDVDSLRHALYAATTR